MITPGGIFVVFGLSIGLIALLALCQALFPTLLARTQANLTERPYRSLLVGLLNFAFFGLISALLLAGDDGAKLLGLIVASILLSFVVPGLAAVAQLLGARLRPEPSDPIRQTIAGALALVLAATVPLVGWFMLPALAGLAGYGAVIIALVRRRSLGD